jgi:hypothetical protein
VHDKQPTLPDNACSPDSNIRQEPAEYFTATKLLNTQQQLLIAIQKLDQHLLLFQELIAQEVSDGHVSTRSASDPAQPPDIANDL